MIPIIIFPFIFLIINQMELQKVDHALHVFLFPLIFFFLSSFFSLSLLFSVDIFYIVYSV